MGFSLDNFIDELFNITNDISLSDSQKVEKFDICISENYEYALACGEVTKRGAD